MHLGALGHSVRQALAALTEAVHDPDDPYAVVRVINSYIDELADGPESIKNVIDVSACLLRFATQPVIIVSEGMGHTTTDVLGLLAAIHAVESNRHDDAEALVLQRGQAHADAVPAAVLAAVVARRERGVALEAVEDHWSI